MSSQVVIAVVLENFIIKWTEKRMRQEENKKMHFLGETDEHMHPQVFYTPTWQHGVLLPSVTTVRASGSGRIFHGRVAKSLKSKLDGGKPAPTLS